MYNQNKSIPEPTPGVWQYVGARYVPIFAEPIEWQQNSAYEPLTIVTYNRNSYTSKKPVPAGVSPENSEYWANTGNFNAQLDELTSKIEGWDDKIEQTEENVAGAVSTANDAKNTADQALNLAQTAKNTADSVKDIADRAETASNNALNTALQLETQVSKNTTNIAANTTAIASNVAELEQLKETLENANITQLKAQVEANATDISELEAENTAQNNSINKNTSDITTLKENDASQANTISNLTGSVEGLNTSQTAQDTKIAALETGLNAANTELQEVSQTVSTLTGQVGTIKAQSDAATAEVNRLTGVVGNENTGLIHDFQQLKNAVESGESVEALAGRVGLLENQVGKPADGDQPATGIELKLEQLGTANSTTQTQLNNLKAQVGTAAEGENPATGIELKLEQLGMANSTTQAQLDSLKVQVGTPADDENPATGIEKEIADLRQQVGEDSGNLSERVAAIEATVGDSTSGLVKDVDSNMGDIATLQADVTEIKGQQSAQDTAISGNTTAISNMSDRVTAASQAADNAQTTAITAQEAAEAAQSGVEEAKTSAAEAKTAAGTAQTAAEAAQATATEAKNAADNKLPLSGGTMTGTITGGIDSKMVNAYNQKRLISFPFSDFPAFSLVAQNGHAYIAFGDGEPGKLTGDSYYNEANSSFLNAVRTPISEYQAANKFYVDKKAPVNTVALLYTSTTSSSSTISSNEVFEGKPNVSQISGYSSAAPFSKLNITGSSSINKKVFRHLIINAPGINFINCYFENCTFSSSVRIQKCHCVNCLFTVEVNILGDSDNSAQFFYNCYFNDASFSAPAYVLIVGCYFSKNITRPSNVYLLDGSFNNNLSQFNN